MRIKTHLYDVRLFIHLSEHGGKSRVSRSLAFSESAYRRC